MPLPLIAWALGTVATLVGVAYVAAKYGDKIQDFINSEDGQKLFKELSKAQEGYEAPYKNICDHCKTMLSEERQKFLRILKNETSSSGWIGLVCFAKSFAVRDPSYLAVSVDINIIDEEDWHQGQKI